MVCASAVRYHLVVFCSVACLYATFWVGRTCTASLSRPAVPESVAPALHTCVWVHSEPVSSAENHNGMQEESRREPCNENLIINELIREYLIYNGYTDTLSVFLPETGQPQTRPFDRDFLLQQLGVSETPHTEQV